MKFNKRIYSLIANLLSYPTDRLPEQIREGINLLSPACPEITGLLNKFSIFVDENQLGKIEELYTAFFDLNPICAPYVGHHLFGDDFHKRSKFMVSLKQFYKVIEFDSGSELPDHFAVIFSFLAKTEDETLARTLLGESLIPAFKKIVDSLENKENPYGQLLSAVLLLGHNQLIEIGEEIKA